MWMASLVAACRALSRRLLHARACASAAPGGAGVRNGLEHPVWRSASPAVVHLPRRAPEPITAFRAMERRRDPEYLPFASSRRLMIIFAMQSALLMPIALFVRFLVLAPIGLAFPSLHRWLEMHASSFAMNPEYRRAVSADMAAKMRRWEMATLAFWAAAFAMMYFGDTAVSRIRHMAGRAHDHQPAEYSARAGRARVRQRGRDSQPARASSRIRSIRLAVRGPSYGPRSACDTTRCTTISLAFPITTLAPRTGASSQRCRGTPRISNRRVPAFGNRFPLSIPKRCVLRAG